MAFSATKVRQKFANMILNLSTTTVSRLPYASKGSRYEVNDKHLPGFIVRIGSRSKAYYWRTTVDGKRITIQLGKDGGTTVEQARTEALKLLLAARTGHLPLSKRNQPKSLVIPTLREAFDEYCRLRKLRETTLHTYNKHFRLYLPDLATRKLTDITTSDILELYKKLRDGKSTAKANGVIAIVKAVMRFSAATYDLALPNITEKLRASGIQEATPTKDDIIPDCKLQLWYESLAEVPRNYRVAMLFTILTGYRVSEVSRLKWKDIDFIAGTCVAEQTKNGKSHTLPLGRRLAVLLSEWHEVEKPIDNQQLVFTNRADRFASITSVKINIKFSMHTLRRTFATNAAKVATNAYIVKALLNHVSNSDVTQSRYIRYSIEDLKATMQNIEDRLFKQWLGL